MTRRDDYESGIVAGSNAAAGQGPSERPARGRTRKSQDYADGWERGYEEVRALQRNQDRAVRMTRNRWAS